MSHDPATDKVTSYHSGECFRNEKLPLYISKAVHSHRDTKAFGAVLIDLGDKYGASSPDERVALVSQLKHVVDSLCVAGEHGALTPDVKAREEGRVYLLVRYADGGDCARIQNALYDSLLLARQSGAKIAVKSFDPIAEQVTPESVIGDLEKLLG